MCLVVEKRNVVVKKCFFDVMYLMKNIYNVYFLQRSNKYIFRLICGIFI